MMSPWNAGGEGEKSMVSASTPRMRSPRNDSIPDGHLCDHHIGNVVMFSASRSRTLTYSPSSDATCRPIRRFKSLHCTTRPRASMRSLPPPPPPPEVDKGLWREEEEAAAKDSAQVRTEVALPSEEQVETPHRSGFNAPIVDALKSAVERDMTCFTFPGHYGGKAAPPLFSSLMGLEVFKYDFSLYPDTLYSPKGPILDAQMQAAALFGSSETWFLVGGTSSGVHASIMATCSPGDTLILPRNAHISATSGMVLSGAVPEYLMPEYSSPWDMAGGITSSQVEKAIQRYCPNNIAAAVLITSPTYQGICSDVRGIAKVCHCHGIPLIVDEAHGAHFRFHPGFPETALEQGADLSVQSTHKVLSSLSQSSMLHMSSDALVDRERVSKCLQTLQSTSPSCLLLASLDAARAQLSQNPEKLFDRAVKLAIEAKDRISCISSSPLILDLSSFNSPFPAMDPLRLTVSASQLGLSGFRANEVLCKEHGVMCELAGSRSLTFAINMGTCIEDILKLVSGINHLSSTTSQNYVNGELGESIPFARTIVHFSPREGFFARKKIVSIKESLGQICGEMICSYPPAIPILNPGEIITEEALAHLLAAKKKGAVIVGAADTQLSSIVVCTA